MKIHNIKRVVYLTLSMFVLFSCNEIKAEQITSSKHSQLKAFGIDFDEVKYEKCDRYHNLNFKKESKQYIVDNLYILKNAPELNYNDTVNDVFEQSYKECTIKAERDKIDINISLDEDYNNSNYRKFYFVNHYTWYYIGRNPNSSTLDRITTDISLKDSYQEHAYLIYDKDRRSIYSAVEIL